MQLINAEVQVHLGNADINYSDAVESEPLTPPTKDMGVDPTPLDTTTVGFADTSPEYHAGDNGLSERNLTQVIRKMNEYQSHPPLPYRGILQATLTSLEQSL